MALSGRVGSVSQIKGSISSGNELVVTRITVPGPQGPQGASGSSQNRIGDAADVDVSTFGLNDGALLQYRAATQKWTARQELDTTSGTIVLNGGNF